MAKAEITLFKPSGKFYTTDYWEIPEGSIGPYDMRRSKDFRRIGGGAVLVESQEPWGYPCLFNAIPPCDWCAGTGYYTIGFGVQTRQDCLPCNGKGYIEGDA